MASNDSADHQETRERLLEAAGEIFSEKGFRAATVREICRRAGANVAAVNYHFGDKERLYIAVLTHTFRVADQHFPLDSGGDSDAPAEARLRAFVGGYLLRLLDSGGREWHGKLIAREMYEPTAALSLVADEMVRPLFELLSDIVRSFLGESAAPEAVKLYARSILGQCLFYFHCRSMVELLNPGLTFDPERIAGVADHICRFSLPALKSA